MRAEGAMREASSILSLFNGVARRDKAVQYGGRLWAHRYGINAPASLIFREIEGQPRHDHKRRKVFKNEGP